jgi:hypothetical protein
MPEPKRHILEEMADSTEKTIQKFPQEHNIVTALGGLYIDTIVKIEELNSASISRLPILMIGIRNFRLLQSASHSIYDGFYDACLLLLRQVYENNLLMQYLANNEKEAENWLNGKPSFLRKKVQDRTGAYTLLSNSFTHANFECLFSGLISEIEGNKLNIKYFPEFNEQYARLSLNIHIIFGWMSLMHLQNAFKNELWNCQEWKNCFLDWSVIVLEHIENHILHGKNDHEK